MASVSPPPIRYSDLLTEEQRETIRRMRAMRPRPSLTEIGKAIDRSTSRVAIYISELGLSVKREVVLTREVVRAATARIDAGERPAEIARELGVETKHLCKAVQYHRDRDEFAGPPPETWVERPCINCRSIFKSWDRRKNQRCDPCTNNPENAGVDDYTVAASSFAWSPAL